MKNVHNGKDYYKLLQNAKKYQNIYTFKINK